MIQESPIAVLPETLPEIVTNKQVEIIFTASGGTPPYRFNGSPLSGQSALYFQTDRLLGYAREPGTYLFTLSATDSRGVTGSRTYSIVVKDGGLVLPTRLNNGRLGEAYSAGIGVTGGVPRYTYTQTGGRLPAGLTFHDYGAVDGTPQQAGLFTIQVKVVDSNGRSGTGSIIVPISNVQLTPDTLPHAQAGVYYSVQIVPINGTPPYTVESFTSPAWPAQLTFTKDGQIQGTPAATDKTVTFTISMADANGLGGYKNYTLIIDKPEGLVLSPTQLPSGTVGIRYISVVQPSGGTAPYQIVMTAGTLPAGLTFDSYGQIQGTPTAAGSFPISVKVTDAKGATISRDFTLVINRVEIHISPATLPAAQLNKLYSVTFTATGGTPHYGWRVLSGTLPNGLQLNQDSGVLSGYPVTAGSSSFTIQTTDQQAMTATARPTRCR